VEKARPHMILIPSRKSPFECLVNSIISQQLSTKAAAAISARFMLLLGGQLSCEAISRKSVQEMQSVGLSKQKASYVTNLAVAFGKGGNLENYNTTEIMLNIETEEIIKLLTTVKGTFLQHCDCSVYCWNGISSVQQIWLFKKGVGEWTAQMYLIFGLGRLEVVAARDLGVRKGIKRIYKLPSVPTEKEVYQVTCHWGALGTVGSFLAWRVIDQNLIEEEKEVKNREKN